MSTVDRTFYFEVLYPLQDQVLGLLSRIETGFYLSGGTAASRGYLNHRFNSRFRLNQLGESLVLLLVTERTRP